MPTNRRYGPQRLQPDVARWVLISVTASSPPTGYTRQGFGGFEHLSYSGYPAISSMRRGPPVELLRAWAVPYWAIVLATALPPAVVIYRRRRRARAALDGRCVQCGYDLRATPERCPECGAVPAASTTG